MAECATVPLSENRKALGIPLESLGLSSFVALDVETTGLDPAVDKIIEVGLCRFRNGQFEAQYSSLIRHSEVLDPFITQLTGLTAEDLKEAPTFSEIAKDLAAFAGDAPLVGHHAEFDMGFLRAAYGTAAGSQAQLSKWTTGRRVLDTSLIARVFWPELSAFGLASLAESFGVAVTHSHRAAADAETTGRVLCRMLSALPERVWPKLAAQLDRIVSTTNHPSRFFFGALAAVACGEEPTQRSLSSEPRRNSTRRDATKSLELLLGESGVFEERLKFFRHRPVQMQMAESVAAALEEAEYLLVEAPTGVGKSLAYLTPALLWIAARPDEDRQVIISSYTKVLQDQLLKKDFPDQIAALKADFTGAVLKGRNNYLCKRRLNHLLSEGLDGLSEYDRMSLLPLVRWSMLTATGDISEIHGFDPRFHSYLWNLVSSDSVACSGSRCSASKGDFYRAAQDRATKADLVFVNHALLISDLSRFAVAGRANRRFVIDEAHHLEQAIINATTLEVSAAVFRSTLTRIADERSQRGLLARITSHLRTVGKGNDLPDEVRLADRIRSVYGSAKQRFALLNDHLGSLFPGAERTGKRRVQPGDALRTMITETLNPFLEELFEFSKFLNVVQQRSADLRGEAKLDPDTVFEFKGACEEVERQTESLRSVLHDASPERVIWIEFSRSGNKWCALYSAPISVGKFMDRAFWPVLKSAVLTSATLTTNGSFELLTQSIGLAGKAEETINTLLIKSPFAVAERMRLLVPTYLPDPRGDSTAHADAVARLTTQIASDVQRGTLVLCTSNDLVERITSALKPLLEAQGRRLLSQWSSRSLAEMLAEFRQRGNAILVGAASLWEGIDVVGDSLQVLIVGRIPFDVPTDPWFEARCESIEAAGGNAFLDYSVPMATLRLRQGLGRLIRHPEDRGVAIIADPRLFTARYGASIRAALPAPATSVNREMDLIDQVSSFFGDRS